MTILFCPRRPFWLFLGAMGEKKEQSNLYLAPPLVKGLGQIP